MKDGVRCLRVPGLPSPGELPKCALNHSGLCGPDL
jgi:hypothetical protein